VLQAVDFLSHFYNLPLRKN